MLQRSAPCLRLPLTPMLEWVSQAQGSGRAGDAPGQTPRHNISQKQFAELPTCPFLGNFNSMTLASLGSRRNYV